MNCITLLTPHDPNVAPDLLTAVTLRIEDGSMPRIVSFDRCGAAVAHAMRDDFGEPAAPQVLNAALDTPARPSLMPTQAEAWAGSPKISIARGGIETYPAFTETAFEHNGSHCMAIGVDRAAGVRLTIRLSIDAGGAVVQQAELHNIADTPLEVRSLMLSMPLPAQCRTVETCTGHHMRERHLERHAFTDGLHLKETHVGRPNFDSTTLMSVGVEGFDWEHGLVCSAHLAWSGDAAHFAERVAASSCALIGGGEILRAGEMILEPGRSYSTPELIVALGEGRNAVTRQLHRAVRAKRPLLRLKDRPVLLNTWEAVYYGQSEERLTALADAAAKVGIERFVIDDGWFRGRRDDTRGLGDWTVDEDVWPQGLGGIAGHVHALGMELGLWFEPEMVNLDSDLARAHPDWILAPNEGRLPLPGRGQHVLDLTNAAARRHIAARIGALVEEYGVDYIKWDHNRYVTEALSPATGRPAVHAQTEALYGLIDDLQVSYPGLSIESCASGGGRIDCGILARTDRVWASDCTDPIERLDIQRGTSLITPPEMIGEHISASPNHATLRSTTLATRAAVAFFGHLGVEWNLLDVPETDLDALRRWIGLYRANRNWIARGDLVHMDMDDPAVRVDGVVSEDRTRAIHRFATVATSDSYPYGRIRLPGLDPTRTYRIRPLGGADLYADELSPMGRTALDWWNDHGTRLNGRALGHWGIRPPQLAPEHAVLIECLAIDPTDKEGAETDIR